MHNEHSGARKHRGRASKESGEVLSPTEEAARHRGQELRRVMRAAAAMHGIYDDLAIADAVGVHRNTVSGWWKGATPEPDTLLRFAEATGLPIDELARFVHYGGPPPRLGWVTSEQRSEAAAWQEQAARDSDGPPPPRPPRRGTRAG